MGVLDNIIESQIRHLQLEGKDMFPRYDSYCRDPKKNLNTEMGELAKKRYAEGSGAEMRPRGNKPAKMASVRSSSAMTFNLLGNDSVTIRKEIEGINSGIYKVDFEKQMHTLGCEGNPANLDAFLEMNQEAVFCEMKMTEWLSTSHGELADKYRHEENYFVKEAYELFQEKIKQIADAKIKRYDAWQMLKHTLAIFNATFVGEADLHKKFHKEEQEKLQLAGKFKKITLANIVYQIEEGKFNSLRTEHSYERMKKEEVDEYQRFKCIMLDDGKLIDLFDRRCNAEFNICFIPTKYFIESMEKSNEEQSYLERYWKL